MACPTPCAVRRIYAELHAVQHTAINYSHARVHAAVAAVAAAAAAAAVACAAVAIIPRASQRAGSA